jgi:signal transduction histidine kinase
MQLKKQRVDAVALVTRVVETARKDVPDTHNLDLDVPRKPVEVDVDADRVATILGNLIDNAVKYSPNGGKVRCSVKSGAGKASIAVSDQGLGIDPEQLQSLFTRFGRVVTQESSRIPGTGLGLYLSRQLARLHGGDITVDSQRGKGSTFTLQLPLAEEKPQREPEPLAEERGRREIA